MGIKELWTFIGPYHERKPLYELYGQKVAIDLAGWICEAQTVVDYFVQPRMYLRNLFFRTCYLLQLGIVPVFVLDGKAPELKFEVMKKRNEIQFRGAKPKDDAKPTTLKSTDRKRFKHVLKRCEDLLHCLGVECVQAPGEAEAYCAFLNKNNLVDGIISQDSDCFAYGARRVYRNFSMSRQSKNATQNGTIDIYDMETICKNIDFGQEKILTLALLCGCDYCPEGVAGVGKDVVTKLFSIYRNSEILDRMRLWRSQDTKYTALEMRVDNKNICSYCGHLGKTISHTKSGCSVCRSSEGCDSSRWKEERLALKAELLVRKNALADHEFPSQKILSEFLTEPDELPALNLAWKEPKLIKFINTFSKHLQWTELYSFQKIFPLITRWRLLNSPSRAASRDYLVPEHIIKIRNLKGISSYEIQWNDQGNTISGLLPAEQLKEFELIHPGGLPILFRTIEPAKSVQDAFPELVIAFAASQELTKVRKPTTKRVAAPAKASKKSTVKNLKTKNLLDLSDLMMSISDVETDGNKKSNPRKMHKPAKGFVTIDKFLKSRAETRRLVELHNSSAEFDLEDLENDENNCSGLSGIIADIVGQTQLKQLKQLKQPNHPKRTTAPVEFDSSLDEIDLLVLSSR